MNKLVLGTVQFGVDYGVSNTRGKIPEKEVGEILDFASVNGIDMLDTAYGYGDSEKIIGHYLEERKERFKLISKLPRIGQDDLHVFLANSLKNLNSASLYAYLFHDFSTYESCPKLWDDLEILKKKSLIKKIGFSLYYPSELETLLSSNIDFDIIQVPYNVFDQRFNIYFSQLKDRGVEVHVRSAFLQGLVFKDFNNLEEKFAPIKDRLKSLQQIGEKSAISVAALCLNFPILNDNIDKVVVGVDNLDNLKENISYIEPQVQKKVKELCGELEMLRFDNEKIILPINWK